MVLVYEILFQNSRGVNIIYFKGLHSLWTADSRFLRGEILDVLDVYLVYRLLIPDFQGGIVDVLNVSLVYGLLIQYFKIGDTICF